MKWVLPVRNSRLPELENKRESCSSDSKGILPLSGEMWSDCQSSKKAVKKKELFWIFSYSVFQIPIWISEILKRENIFLQGILSERWNMNFYTQSWKLIVHSYNSLFRRWGDFLWKACHNSQYMECAMKLFHLFASNEKHQDTKAPFNLLKCLK